MIAATLRHRHWSRGIFGGSSLERGRSRILVLSKASLEAPGTGPITSTSYCVCSSRHSVRYLSPRTRYPSARSSLGWPPHGREDREWVFSFLVCTYRPTTHARLLPPPQTSTWPSIYRNMSGTLRTVRSDIIDGLAIKWVCSGYLERKRRESRVSFSRLTECCE